MTKRTRKIVIIVAALLAVPLIAYIGLLALIFVGPSIESRTKTTEFESAAWKEKALDGDARWPTRLRMVDDLLEGGVLAAAKRNEVINLLGPPDDTSYFREWSMVYWLGPERGVVRIDSEWLVLRFDESNTVTEVRLERD
jgi:hypothetical protein